MNWSCLYQKCRNLILYAGIGCITTAIDVAIFMLLTKTGMKELIANTISYQSAMVVSFLLNRHYNFKVKDRFWWRFLSFAGINLAGYFASQLLVYLLINEICCNAFLGKLIATCLAGLIQYFFIKQVTFKIQKRKSIKCNSSDN